MPDMQRSRGICTNKFHLNVFPLARIQASVAIVLFFNDLHGPVPDVFLKKEINKTGAGNLGLIDDLIIIDDVFQNRLRDFPRILLHLRRQNHGGIGGIIAVLAVGGRFDFRIRQMDIGKLSFLPSMIQSVFYNVDDFIFHNFCNL